jgi:poly(hydroxyalkanoate) depolymerase family esterase
MFASKVDMFEALRLTRAGKLVEAMALLKGEQPAPSEQGVKDQSVVSGNRSVFVDLMPPSDPTGSWATRSMRSPSPVGPSFQFHTLQCVAGTRRYKLYVPAGYHGQALPLVIMLHGCTQSPDDFAAGTRMNELAAEQLFFVAYPEQPQSANAQKCWNWFNASDQGRDSGEPLLIAEVTREIMRDHSVDEDRVYIAGMSAGGAAAAIMGAVYPDLYAAVGIHSGLACGAARDVPGAFAAMRNGAQIARGASRNARPVPTIVFHGDQDSTVSPINGEQVIAQATDGLDFPTTASHAVSADGTPFTRIAREEDTGRSVSEYWLIHGLGHAWSGGSRKGTFTDARGPDASREFVRFFLQNRRGIAGSPSTRG